MSKFPVLEWIFVAHGRASGAAIEVPLLMRLDTPAEVECFRQGGLLPGYLRTLMNAP